MSDAPYITFSELLERFDIILFDSDGVPHAAEAIARLNVLGKPYFIRGANNVGIASALVETGGGFINLSTLPASDIATYRLQSLAL